MIIVSAIFEQQLLDARFRLDSSRSLALAAVISRG